MSLKAKIKKAVDNAFTALQDLVEDGTLSNKTATSYDFSTGTTQTKSKKETVKVIILERDKQSGVRHDEVKAVIKSGPSLDVYDRLTVASIDYQIVSYTDNGYSVDLILKKEA